MQAPERRVYMNIPFCNSRCSYCCFYKYPLNEKVPPFIDSTLLLMERLKEQPYVKGKQFETFYVGGGTPTAFPVEGLTKLIGSLLQNFSPVENYELTVESNICDISEEYLYGLKNVGVNRISLGVQTFDTEMRRRFGRQSDQEQIIKIIELVLESGFRTNVDLIYGFPGQTVDDFIKQVNLACRIGVDSQSHYGLNIHPGTPLQKLLASGKSVLPSPEERMNMQVAGWEETETFSYKRWNIKNFGRTKEEYLRHTFQGYNLSDLVPIGCGAEGNVEMVKINTHKDINRYIEEIREGSLPFVHRPMREEEWYFKALSRLIKQTEVDLARLGKRFNFDHTKHRQTLNELSSQGLIKDEGNVVKLTKEGILHVSKVIKELGTDII